MYLKVVNGTKSKEYTLTSQYNEKPYMIVSGSNKLPLTTKPPLDYTTHSESGTFYTTAETPKGLRETTALTRSSTYETVYGTRASTSNTVYGTIADKMNTATGSGWDPDKYDYGGGYIGFTVHNYTRSVYDGYLVFYGNAISGTMGDNPPRYNVTYYGFPYDCYESHSGTAYYRTRTTGTTYLTRVSTSATSYLTQSSTSVYRGVSSTSSSTSYATNPGSNIYIKISKGTKTYRPLEYQSSSESASMYTTVGEDKWYLLSETTALTRESTSQTVYGTRASTYNTVYGTSNRLAYSSARFNGILYNYNQYNDNISVSGITRTNSYRVEEYYVYSYYYSIYGNISRNGGVYFGTSGKIYCPNAVAFSPVYQKITTGTTYLTRASTSTTVYMTCSSTSAYSGISSSSQSTMSWV